MKSLQDARNKMDRVIANWFVDDTILLYTWSLLEKIPSKHQTTIGIDSRSNPPQILFNPNFINSIPYEILEMVLASEAFKLLLRHATDRMQDPKEISGLASQLTVDQIVTKNCQNVPGVKETFPLPKDFDLPENSYKEDYFRRLRENLDEMMENIQSMFGDEPDSEDGENESGGSCSNDSDEQKDENGFKEYSNSQEAMNEYLDPRKTTCNCNWGGNDMLDADIKNLVDNFKGSSKMWGKFSGDYVEQIVAAHTPRISAREILRRFNTSISSSKTLMTRMKPNRRFDMEAQGRRRINTTRVLFAADISGSMSNEMIADGCAVVNSTCKHCHLDFMTFDTTIKSIDKKFKRPKKEFKITGRGGTCVDEVLKYAEENNYDGLVLFSDMFFDTNLRQPKGVKVLWLGCEKDSKKPTQWGYFATLDEK